MPHQLNLALNQLYVVRKFNVFNTNNLWINLNGELDPDIILTISNAIVLALKKIMDNGGMDLEIIVNPKVTDDGHSVIQVCNLYRLSPSLTDCLESWRRLLALLSDISEMSVESTFHVLVSFL
jgi:hypothetical protein